MKELSLEEKKRIGLEILLDLDAVCKNNGIEYYLAYGSLLGAVRHKGFIPWDDDIDVWVKIQDYEKLLDILKHESKYEVLSNRDSQQWVNSFSKLADPTTIVIDSELSPNERHGIAVDIFPVFECNNDLKWIKKIRHYQTLIFRTQQYSKNDIKISNIKDIAKKINVYSNILFGRNLGYQRNRIFQMQLEPKGTNLLGCPLSPYQEKDIHSAECFSSQILLEFEHSLFPAPVGYKRILENLYGDYMQLPPPEKRCSDHAEKVIRLEEV